jgi:hypothetical protein
MVITVEAFMSNTNRPLRGLIDRPFYTGHIKNFDKMTVELSPYMTEYEIDSCIDFMFKLQDTKFDINPSATDCKSQFELMFGRERFLEICKKWNEKNQKWLTSFGQLKYKGKVDGVIYDGLDPEDNPDDYEKIYI